MTPKQQQLIAIIRDYTADHGYAPTVREIMTLSGSKSVGGTVDMIERLEKQGHLKRGDTGSRNITLVEVDNTVDTFTSVGQAAQNLLRNILRENPKKGYAIVSAEALGDLDIAVSEMNEAAHG